jgi:3-oxoadipate enol-lactonase
MADDLAALPDAVGITDKIAIAGTAVGRDRKPLPQSFAAINRMLAESTVTDELPHISCPTMVVGCTHDKLRPPSDIESMAGRISNAEYLVMNSEHFAAIQTPGRVSQAFHGFFSAQGF